MRSRPPTAPRSSRWPRRDSSFPASRTLSALQGGEGHARSQAMVRRVAAHEPLSRITGHREFWGRDFVLSRDTLDPRPETETVVEAVLARFSDRDKPYRFLDLGTGSGCLLLALLSEYPQASGIA